MLTSILLGLAAIVAIIGIIAAFKPAQFRITRTATLNAPPAVVFFQVNNFHKWEAWSSWAKLDPNAKNSFTGAESGLGAMFSWDGNRAVGRGAMTIVESHPDDLIRIKLEFIKPFKATHNVEFTFKPEGSQTVVSWSMYGNNSYLAKVMLLFMDCDKMIGGCYEKGLAQLKSVSESACAVAAH